MEAYRERARYAGGSTEFSVDRSVLPLPKPLSISIDKNIAWLREANIGGAVRSYAGSAGIQFTTALRQKIEGVPISVLDKNTGKIVATQRTDKEGKAVFSLSFKEPGSYSYLVFPGDRYIPILSEQLGELLKIGVWLIAIETRNLTDVWARFQGRGVLPPGTAAVPHAFWLYGFAVGLAGWMRWVELVPAVEGQKIKYEVAVSAVCNTPEPNPTGNKCCEYRRNTWWVARLYATNNPTQAPKQIGEDRVNIALHSVYYIYHDRIEHQGLCLADWDPVPQHVGICGWERSYANTSCRNM